MKRVIARLLFPDDEIEGNDVAALPAARLVEAAKSAVKDGRIEAIQRARLESGAHQADDTDKNVDDLYLDKLLEVSAGLVLSVRSDP